MAVPPAANEGLLGSCLQVGSGQSQAAVRACQPCQGPPLDCRHTENGRAAMTRAARVKSTDWPLHKTVRTSATPDPDDLRHLAAPAGIARWSVNALSVWPLDSFVVESPCEDGSLG